MSAKATPYALDRIDGLLARMFAAAALLLSVDLVTNALAQRSYLHALWFWGSFGLVAASQLSSAIAAFFSGSMKLWYRALTISTFIALASWPLEVRNLGDLPAGFTPWVWWAIGFSALAAVGGFREITALIILVVMPVMWLTIRTSPIGGGKPLGEAIQDSLYSFFFSTAMALLVMALRQRSMRVDDAYRLQLTTAARSATLEAIERERVRIDSIAHGKVLSTLALATAAINDEQRATAAMAAIEAIGRIEREAKRVPNGEAPVSTETFFEALGTMVSSQTPGVEYHSKSQQVSELPFDQAVTLAEVTIEVALNSLKHAAASRHSVSIENTASSLKITVSDDGTGFRVGNLGRANIGVRRVVFDRCKAFGIKVNYSKTEGSRWIFEVKHDA